MRKREKRDRWSEKKDEERSIERKEKKGDRNEKLDKD